MKDIFWKLMFNILKNYMNVIMIYHLYMRMKTEKVEKLIANSHDKTEYVIHIRNLKQEFNHRLILRKFYRVINFNQSAWLKPYIDMNIDLRKKAKNDFEEDFFKLMNNAVFEKNMENVRKHKRY